MRRTIVSLLLVLAGPAHAEPVIGAQLSGLAGPSYEAHLGVGGYISGGMRYGDPGEAWIEPGATLRFAEFRRSTDETQMIDPMAGVRAGIAPGVVQPWIGAYVGVTNRMHRYQQGTPDEEMSTTSGLALDGAVGIDVGPSSGAHLSVRFDVDRDQADTWFGLGVGVLWLL
jgi:hypothetical protein